MEFSDYRDVAGTRRPMHLVETTFDPEDGQVSRVVAIQLALGGPPQGAAVTAAPTASPLAYPAPTEDRWFLRVK